MVLGERIQLNLCPLGGRVPRVLRWLASMEVTTVALAWRIYCDFALLVIKYLLVIVNTLSGDSRATRWLLARAVFPCPFSCMGGPTPPMPRASLFRERRHTRCGRGFVAWSRVWSGFSWHGCRSPRARFGGYAIVVRR
eukprot:COSAG03_NODE_1130_length_4760_cov_589.277623_6_plen_138_part_00